VSSPAIPTPGAIPTPAGPRSILALWSWGWLAIVQLVLDLFAAIPFLLILGLLVTGLSLIPAFLIGVPLVALALVLAMGCAALERSRLRALTGVRIDPPPPPSADQPTWHRLLLDWRPWRATAYLTLVSLWGLVAGAVMLTLTCIVLALATVPLYRSALPSGTFALPWGAQLPASGWTWLTGVGIAGLVVLPLVARGLVALDMSLGRVLLGRSQREQVRALSQRVETLTQTRAAAVDSVEAERRRIERDLHDGPQQRLVAIAMDLGMAREKLDSNPAGARELLDRAHASAKEAITEMRQVARGITPPVLTDRGLDAALSALAARSPVPVEVRVNVPQRPSPTVEAISYFCVSEALTNVAKHSAARSARVDVTSDGSCLTVRVADDGVGGADSSRGTGLVGLRDRLRAVDGTLEVASWPGGGTVLTAVLPTSRVPAAPPASAPSPSSTRSTP